jgi:hypothetical protein
VICQGYSLNPSSEIRIEAAPGETVMTSWQHVKGPEELAIRELIKTCDGGRTPRTGFMYGASLSFYGNALLVRVMPMSPGMPEDYFIIHQGQAIPLRGLNDVQPRCDLHFSPLTLDAQNAGDYFRFAWFFTSVGRHERLLVENKEDVSAVVAPYVLPLVTTIENGTVFAVARVIEKSTGALFVERYRLTCGRQPECLESVPTGLTCTRSVFLFANLEFESRTS